MAKNTDPQQSCALLCNSKNIYLHACIETVLVCGQVCPPGAHGHQVLVSGWTALDMRLLHSLGWKEGYHWRCPSWSLVQVLGSSKDMTVNRID